MLNLGVDIKVIDYVEIQESRVRAYNALYDHLHKTQSVVGWNLKPDILVHGSPCFLAGELINTTEGMKPIEQLTVGDEVISHDGTINKVYETFVSRNNQMVNLTAAPIHDIKTTANHPFYVERSGKKQWVIANELTTRDFLLTPINKREKPIEWGGVELYYNNHTEISNKLPLEDKDFWYVIGRFIGDGWVTTRKERNGNVSGIKICCSHQELKGLLPAVQKFFKTTVIKERTVYKIQIPNKELGAFCSIFGLGAANKHIPQVVLDMPVPLLTELVNGIRESDGCVTRNQMKVTTVSERLAYTLGEALLKVYRRPYRIYKTERPKQKVLEGRLINQKDTFQIVMALGGYSEHLQFVDDDYLYSRIRKIEHYDEENAVYNIEVENTHSYCVKNIATHNCQDNSQAQFSSHTNKKNKKRGAEKDSGTRSSLMHETVKIIKQMGEWKPKFVIWENVTGVLAGNTINAFNTYLHDMSNLGYTNSFEVVNSLDFGIPHSRERVFCISVLNGDVFDFSKLKKKEMQPISDFLEYTAADHDKVPDEYIINIPSMLNRIEEFNPIKSDEKYKRRLNVITDHCWTITERQDRCPNSGILRMDNGQYRYLTERECWRLLGFDDADYNNVAKKFPKQPGKRSATMYALAGNSIVVSVLEAIFEVLLSGDYAVKDDMTEKNGQMELVI